jgi:hypothetical protein
VKNGNAPNIIRTHVKRNMELLMNKEKYQENGNIKSKPFKFDRTSSPIQMTEEDMNNTLVTGYIIKKKDPRGVHITPTFFG